jgi:protein-tyrosine phosphatase
MRRIDGFHLWIGTARDARDIKGVLDAGILAIVDLAMEEPPITPTRELVYLRFPLLDGESNKRWILHAVTSAVEELVRNGIPTLVACSGGMSRSPTVVAAVLARLKDSRAETVLGELQTLGPCDVSPGLWHEMIAAHTDDH